MFSSFASTRTLRLCMYSTKYRRTPSLITSRQFPRTAKHSQRNAGALNDLPVFKEELYKESPGFQQFKTEAKPPVLKQVVFVIAGSITAFYLTALATNEDTLHWMRKLSGTSWLRTGGPSSENMKRARYLELGKRLQTNVDKFKEATSELPRTIQYYVVSSYAHVAQAILDATEGRRIAWQICAANGAVWLLWQIPRLQPMMERRFLHHPLSGLSYTLLTSVFSHKSFIHLLFNCMALSSFASAATLYLTREQASPSRLRESTAQGHFFAFYVSAGLFSALVSHVISARIRFPRLISKLSSTIPPTPKARRPLFTSDASSANAVASGAETILPSLGASGAIYASVVLSALAFPDAEVALIIPPSYPIPIAWGVGGMVCLDILGVLRGWRLFDHWAHLGGAAFGALYYIYGPQLWNALRVATLRLSPVKKPEGSSSKQE